MGASVQIKDAILVTPSDPTPSQILKLSALDSQLFLRFTIEYLLVYNPPRHSSDRLAITARVKSALARALVPYYPLAGRVRPRPDGSSLEVVCRAQGAVFIEATSDYTAADFDRAPRYVSQWRKLLALQVADVLKGAPPLVAQLTWLSDGAAALAVGFSHCVCDGVGSAEFLNSFAELASGKRGPCEFKPRPVWDRHLLDPTPFKQVKTGSISRHDEFSRVPDLCGFMTQFTHDRITPTSITFDQWRLSELKKLAGSPGQLTDSGFTSFEVLSAHIWRSWAKALNFPPNQVLKLLFSVNVRSRLKPSLPVGYYGNAIVLGCAQTTAKDLTSKPLSYAAELIRQAKNRVNNEYVREVVESVSLAGASSAPDSVGVLILSQWSRVGLERVDFGLGRPVQVGPVCTDRFCILLPVYDQSRSVKVMLAVPTVAVDKYEYLIGSTNC